MLAVAFQRAGFETDVAERGAEAVTLIERNADKYCCVLLDLNIAPPDGLGIANFIRQQTPNLPVIVVSGNADLIDRIQQEDLRAVVRLVVMKPVDPQTLIPYVHTSGHCIRHDSGIAHLD